MALRKFNLIQDTDVSLAELLYLVHYNLHRVDKGQIIEKSIWYHKENFINYFKRLMDENQVIVLKDKSLMGMCSWVQINEEDFVKLNKLRWTLPEKIHDGNILYITMCVLERNASMFGVKRKLEELGMRDKVKEVRWYNYAKGHPFLNKLKES